MKTRLILVIVLAIMISNMASAQFSLEKIYDHSLSSTKINATEYKYFLMDVVKSECRIYNTDHSLFRAIPISLPAEYYLSDIKFVSQNLFNSDSDIELWYSAYNWVPVGNDGYYRYISKVISDKGNILASIDGGLYANVIKSTDDTYKLAVYAYDNSFWPGSVKTHIFSLPGTQTAIYHAVAKLADPYPNPSGGVINLPLPTGENSGKLQVFSVSGHLMIEAQLTGQPIYRLQTSGWAPGTYTYRVVSENNVSEIKKFVVH